MLLVIVTALPALALTAYSTLEQRARAESHARDDLLRLTRLAARQQEQIVEGAKLLLTGSSRLLAILQHDRKRCDEYFKSLLEASPGLYHSMGLFDTNGYLRCNAKPWKDNINSRDRRYVRLALDSGKFSIGEYQIGRVTRQQAVNFGYPIVDAQNKISGVAFIGLDLDVFNRMAAATSLPDQTILTVTDLNGIILARQPFVADRIGEKLRVPAVLKELTTGKGGLFEARNQDGVERLFAYQTVTENPDGSIPIRVSISIPLKVVFADANETLIRNLAGIVLATLLLLVGAWYGTEWFVLRNVRLLLDTANRVRSGDLGARTGLRKQNDELSLVGHAFDEMAQALQQREVELRQAMHNLHAQAITDTLTGLYNRRYLLDILPRELLRAKRSGSSLAVVMLDVDHFKQVNDSFGHEAGDMVLKELGALLKDNSRGGDTACRYGGEEFLIILPETSLEGAMQKAEAIRAAMKNLQLRYRKAPLGSVRASFGIALFPGHAANTDSLLRAADEALYEAKGRGRDRIVVSTAKPASR
jgi:diguanylate cyclase (GGDEF)-like protein